MPLVNAPSLNEPTVRHRAHIPLTLSAKVEMLLRDPVRPGKRIYGGFSRLVTLLLLKYFNDLEEGRTTVSELFKLDAETPAEDSNEH